MGLTRDKGGLKERRKHRLRPTPSDRRRPEAKRRAGVYRPLDDVPSRPPTVRELPPYNSVNHAILADSACPPTDWQRLLAPTKRHRGQARECLGGRPPILHGPESVSRSRAPRPGKARGVGREALRPVSPKASNPGGREATEGLTDAIAGPPDSGEWHRPSRVGSQPQPAASHGRFQTLKIRRGPGPAMPRSATAGALGATTVLFPFVQTEHSDAHRVDERGECRVSSGWEAFPHGSSPAEWCTSSPRRAEG